MDGACLPLLQSVVQASFPPLVLSPSPMSVWLSARWFWTTRGMTNEIVENDKVQRMEDKLLSPRPRWSANTVTVRNVVRFVRISSVSIIVLLCVQCHSFTVLIAEITVQWCRMHVRQYVYILFVLPHYSCQVTYHLSLCHPSSILFYVQNSSASLLFGLTVLKQFTVLVCKLSDGVENKLSMYNLCRTFSVLLFQSHV
jgi:hypothetical protein